MRTLKSVKEFAELTPFSVGQLRWWMHAHRENGLFEAKALVRVGKRVYIDVARFDAWLEAMQDRPPMVAQAAKLSQTIGGRG